MEDYILKILKKKYLQYNDWITTPFGNPLKVSGGYQLIHQNFSLGKYYYAKWTSPEKKETKMKVTKQTEKKEVVRVEEVETVTITVSVEEAKWIKKASAAVTSTACPPGAAAEYNFLWNLYYAIAEEVK